MTSGSEAATVATEAAGLGPSFFLADTHLLIWYATAPNMPSMTALRMMEQSVAAGQTIVIASVYLIELVYIAEKRSDSIDADTLLAH
jgi:PIN domain nuclease of toxin-antitoxin system